MQRYAFMFLFLCSFSAAHASLPDDAAISLTPDDVSAFVRISPESNIEKSELFETTPEEAMEEYDTTQDSYASSDHKTPEQVGSKKKKSVRCISDSGGASFYSEPQAVASGGRFNPNAMTAAHRKLPFGTQVRVTNVKTGKSVIVTINDRGPFVGGRIIDLSRASFAKIASLGQGVARVKLDIVSCEN